MQDNNSALEISKFLSLHNALDTVVLDVRKKCSWTDYFVVATITSTGHLKGLTRELWNFLVSLNIHPLNRHKTPDISGWELIDCGNIVIHLMSEELRKYYSIEELFIEEIF